MTVFMTFCAQYLYLVIILIAAVYFLIQERALQKSMGFVSLISLPIAFIIGKIAGVLYKEPRPFVLHHFQPLIKHAVSNGFPSDHALLCFTVAAIIFAFNKKLGMVLFILSLLVSIGRVYVGVHTWIDIGGSFVIGVGVVSFLQKFIRTKPSSLIS